MEQRIPVTQASAGMIVARPVLLPDRMVLVGEGAVLSDAMITQMLKRGIKLVVVQGEPVARTTSGAFDTRMVALATRFSRVNHIPLMRALREVVARHVARRS